MRSTWSLSILATAVLLVLTGCGTGPMPGAALRPGAGPAVLASAPSEEEAALMVELATAALETLAHADSTYAALKLNTAHGRKITPDKEPMLIAGLTPLVSRFEEDGSVALARLHQAGTPKMSYMARELSRLGPPIADPDGFAAAVEPTASELIYRVAQHRVRFGFLIEYVNRKGLLPKAPTWDQGLGT